jgi:hypothetical protein
MSCTCATATELACPVHPETASVMPPVTSDSRTPYPRPARLIRGPLHAALDAVGRGIERCGEWLLDRIAGRRFS